MTAEERKVEEMHYKTLFSKKLIELMKYKKVSLQEIGHILGKSTGTVSHWKRKMSIPVISDIAYLAKSAELDLNYFFDPDMTIEQADLTLRTRKKTDFFTDIKENLHTENNDFSPERKELAQSVENIPEDTVEYISCIVQTLMEKISD